ncbi:MAG: hypothetical protein F6J97_18585 [Leptolyngbya sp. SIO4C1]|nr:hypothetical protein [Leptolyngbya sp. SIO4C1]
MRREISNLKGQALDQDYCHSFTIDEPIRHRFLSLDGRRLPSQRSARVETGRLLDYLSARSYLAVTDAAGQRLPAVFSPSADGQAVLIDLLEAPQAQQLILRAHERLEDVAGNRAAAAFEVTCFTCLS